MPSKGTVLPLDDPAIKRTNQFYTILGNFLKRPFVFDA